MNSLGATILICCTALIFFGSRKWALLSMAAAILYLPEYQAVEILTINLTALRLLEIALLIRITLRKEFYFIQLNAIDRAILLVYGYSTLVFLLRTDIGHAESIGTMVDTFISYFGFRTLVRNVKELESFLHTFVFFLAPFVTLLIIEMWVQKNPFNALGNSTWDFELRRGRIRCMGSFRHPALLGTLGASMLPLYTALLLSDKGRTRALLGIGLCSAIIVLANSGGPVLAAVVGIVGWFFWFIRTHMRAVRYAIIAVFFLLALFMKAPIWYLPARLSSITGGGGWHRSYLLDVAIRNLDSWWIAGMDLERTKGWFPYLVEATGAADITNQFLAFGLDAGLFATFLLVLLLTRVFQLVGQTLSALRQESARADECEFALWALGCVALVHTVTWFGITYFDQTHLLSLFHFAAISSIFQTFRPTHSFNHTTTIK